MTLTAKDIFSKRTGNALPLFGLGILAAALSGCGGATSGGAAGVATPNSGPVIYGVNALALSSGQITTAETSGLSFDVTSGSGTAVTTTSEGVITGATAYHTLTGPGPLPIYQSAFPNTGTTSSPGVPLGFAPNGAYYGTSSLVAALPTNYTGTLVFGTYISPPVQNSQPINLNTGSVVLTSPEAPSFSQPLTFDPNFGNGVLSQAQYKTQPFAIPAFLQTTGLHILRTGIADTGSPVQSSTTDFSVLTLAPTDSAALVTINYTSGSTTAPVAGATVTITNALPTVAAYKDASVPAATATIPALPATTSYTDAQGVGIVFAQPGPQTITINGIDPVGGVAAITGTATVTLVAGQATATINIAAVKGTTAPTAAAIAHAKMVQRHIVKR